MTSDFFRPLMLSAIASITAHRCKKVLIEQLAQEATQDIQIIDKARDLHVRWVYQRFRAQVKNLEASAGETDTPSADHPSIAYDQVTTIIEETSPMFTSPLKHFCLSSPGSREAAILAEIEEICGPQFRFLDEADKGAAIICLIAAANTRLAIRMDKSVKKIKAMHRLLPLLEGLSTRNKLCLAMALINQLVYGGR
jgi:hypothetical protein